MIGYGLLSAEQERKRLCRGFAIKLSLKKDKPCLEQKADTMPLQELDPNLFMQVMYLEIKRLFSMYGGR